MLREEWSTRREVFADPIERISERKKPSDLLAMADDLSVTYVLVVLLFVCCFIGCWLSQSYDSSHVEVIDVRDFQRRQDLVDSQIEHEWQCIVCAHLNHPDYSSCVLCGCPVKASMASSLERSPSDPEQQHRDGELLSEACLLRVDGSGTNELTLNSRHRALRYRRLNQMHLNQRQRGAQRRRLWQRARLPGEKFAWIRVGSHPNQLFPSRWAQKSSTLLEEPSDLSPSRQTLLARSPSIGFVSEITSLGDMLWTRADSVSIQIKDENDAEVLGDPGSDLEGVVAMRFSEKKRWFLRKLSDIVVPLTTSLHLMHVHRESLFDESFHTMINSDADERVLEHLKISFEGEPGLDAGGVLREWFSLVCKELFSTERGLFCPTHAENMAYWINPHSVHAAKDHLQYFKFAGRLFGKAMLENLCFDAHLALPLLKHWLGVPISFSDLEFLDEEIYKSSCWIRDNDGVDALCLTFCVTTELGETVDLKPNGREIDVTDENKSEYLMLLLRYYMLDSVSAQLQALLSGLYEIVPRSLLSVFDYQELDFFLCGLPTINVKDWQRYCLVIGLDGKESKSLDWLIREKPMDGIDQEGQVLLWFWDVVEAFTQEERGRVLQFVTGSSRVPVEGFKALTSALGIIKLFTIQLVVRGVPPGGLCPRAHTCFNRMDLPVYESREELENWLSLVIHMEIAGFGLE